MQACKSLARATQFTLARSRFAFSSAASLTAPQYGTAALYASRQSASGALTREERAQVRKLVEEFPFANMGVAQLLTGYGVKDSAVRGTFSALQRAFFDALKKELGVRSLIMFGAKLLKAYAHAPVTWKDFADAKTALPHKHNKRFLQAIADFVMVNRALVEMYGVQYAQSKWHDIHSAYAPAFGEIVRAYMAEKVPQRLQRAFVAHALVNVLKQSHAAEGVFEVEVRAKGESSNLLEYGEGTADEDVTFVIKKCDVHEKALAVGGEEYKALVSVANTILASAARNGVLPKIEIVSASTATR